MQSKWKSANSPKHIYIYLLSFIVPAAVMTAVFALHGVWPFGSGTVMIGDTTYQFVDYLSYLKTILFGNNDLTYSLSKTMGGEMAGFAAYYYNNPLYILTFPFNRKWIPVGISLIFILSSAFCSLSLCIVLSKLHGPSFSSLLFSYGYGLMAFMIVYNELFQHFMNFILLPVVYYGLRKLLRQKKGNLIYILSLTAVIIGNYYTGYMICLFCLLYFIYETLLSGFEWKKTLLFAVSSLAAGGLSAAVLIPALLSLSGEKEELSIGLFLRMNPLDLFSKLYTGSFQGDLGTGLPNIFCGIIITVLLIWYFFCREISKKEKILTGAAVLFFIVNFSVNTLYVIWHGFNQPIGFPYRFAFLFTFFMIIKADESFAVLSSVDEKKAALITALIFLLYSAYLLIHGSENTSFVSVAIDAVLISAVLLLLIRKPKQYLIYLILLQVLDLGLNAHMSLKQMEFTDLYEYQAEIGRIEEALDTVRKEDPSLYRIEKYFRRSNNDAMMFDYAGLSHYSSAEKKETIRFMGKLGFRDNGNWAFYNGGNTSFVDALFGVKYVISQFSGTGKPFEKIEGKADYSIFRNPYALPLIFSCSREALSVRKEGADPFEFQQQIADGILGEKASAENRIFTKLSLEPVEISDRMIRYEFTIPKDGILEAYLSAPDVCHAHVFLDQHDYGEYFSTYEWGILDLQHRKAGEKHTITVEAGEGEVLRETEIFVYQEDFDALSSFYEKVNGNPCLLQKKTSSEYIGSVETDTEYLLFSVPYDKGWRAYIDGSRAEISPAAENLTAIRVPAGAHEIRLKYHASGRNAGLVISIISLIFVIAGFRRRHIGD